MRDILPKKKNGRALHNRPGNELKYHKEQKIELIESSTVKSICPEITQPNSDFAQFWQSERPTQLGLY